MKLLSSRRLPTALVIAWGVAYFGLAPLARADILTFHHTSVTVPTGLLPGTEFEFEFGGLSDSNPAAQASDFTVTPNPFPAGSAPWVVATTAAQRAGGAPDFSLFAYFTIAQLSAISTLTGTITDAGGDTADISQPVTFSTGLSPFDLTGLQISHLTGLLLHIPIGAPSLLPVTITDPLGHISVETVSVIDGQIELPLTAPLPGLYVAQYSIGHQDFVVQRDVAVAEPGAIWILGPGLLTIVLAGLRRRRSRS